MTDKSTDLTQQPAAGVAGVHIIWGEIRFVDSFFAGCARVSILPQNGTIVDKN